MIDFIRPPKNDNLMLFRILISAVNRAGLFGSGSSQALAGFTPNVDKKNLV